MVEMNKINIGFLASCRGTNMQAIMDACKNGSLPAEPVVVISNNGSSGALDRAKSETIPAYHLSNKNYPDAEQLDQVISDTLQKHAVDLVLLAGYMKMLGPITLRLFKGRIINIHPSLLPKHGGRGMYGKHVHAAVLAAGDTETGVTVHLVDGKYDTGTILAQHKISVKKEDSAESLAERVLSVEHEFYVETLDKILSGEIKIKGIAVTQT